MRYTIQNKILVSLCIVVFISLSSLLLTAYRITDQNIVNIINGDMTEAKKNIDFYMKQYFMVYNMEFSRTSIIQEAGNISR
ncbi:MAG TPA: sensor histidine kinase, partial [Clostridiaceae bacterium]|nr:sensor histidine kinase [Clostridiaceae bacterium]